MIPSEIAEMQNGVLVGHLGTRNNKLHGTEVFVWTVNVNVPQKQVTAYISKNLSDKTIANVTDNKKMALVIVDPLTHRSFQLKGDYCSHRECDEAEYNKINGSINKFYDGYLKQFGYPPEIINTFMYKPVIAITMDVETVFVQTPGPNAGQKISA